jgi:erythromycin esterase-like protein
MYKVTTFLACALPREVAMALLNKITPYANDAELQPLIDAVASSHYVLIGEASHGTHEFYATRASITKELISKHGFTAVCIEGDWPDAYRVNEYVRGRNSGVNADNALSGFSRFPTWMWRNTVVQEFVEWLKQHNASAENKAGFYGLDLYSMYTSIDEVIKSLKKIDPEAAERAKRRYSCLEHFAENPQVYGYASTVGMTKKCEDDVIKQLSELQQKTSEAYQIDGASEERLFYIEQNARLVSNAEQYYRSMFNDDILSWNVRDEHMAETLDELVDFLGRNDQKPKVVVWAHNSHLGDARATERSDKDELNLGQLVRERHRDTCSLIGFTTYTGTVTAASDWDAPAEKKQVRPGYAHSYEELFHTMGEQRFFLQTKRAMEELSEPRLERAIGVIYRPETERYSHYFHAHITQQFDWVIHIDTTSALIPLEPTTKWHSGEAPETFPSGL